MVAQMRDRWDELPLYEQDCWKEIALATFLAGGHSFADECSQKDRDSWIAWNAEAAWGKANRNWLERWSHGWYGMTWRDHRSMFRNNFIGHRNMQTYVGGPKMFIPPRRGPLRRAWIINLMGYGQTKVAHRLVSAKDLRSR